jgi:hypothetical protein
VDQVAPVDRVDGEPTLGLLHRLDAEEVVHEVGVRALGPRLEPAGRGALDRGQLGRERGEVAVEPGERRAAALYHDVLCGGQHGVTGEGGVAALPPGHGGQPELLLAGGDGHPAEATGEGRHVVEPPRSLVLRQVLGAKTRHTRQASGVGQEPARRGPLAGSAEVAPRRAQHALLGGGQRGQEVPAVVVEPPGAER